MHKKENKCALLRLPQYIPTVQFSYLKDLIDYLDVSSSGIITNFIVSYLSKRAEFTSGYLIRFARSENKGTSPNVELVFLLFKVSQAEEPRPPTNVDRLFPYIP